MGIYIKGLKAPASCCKCRMGRWSNYYQHYRCEVCDKEVAKFASAYNTSKPDWCPVAEVQEPHGDLIDRDALEADICPDWNGLYVPDNAYSEKLIRNAPTIIEAEGSEDDADN